MCKHKDFSLGIFPERVKYENYRKPLPADSTLCVYNEERLIFCSSGKWLLPLFDFECFMRTYNGSRENLCIHDSAIGKAAAVLMVRQGIKYIHGNIVSKLAMQFVDKFNSLSKNKKNPVTITYDSSVEKIKCATEEQLAPYTDIEQMYKLLVERLNSSN